MILPTCCCSFCVATTALAASLLSFSFFFFFSAGGMMAACGAGSRPRALASSCESSKKPRGSEGFANPAAVALRFRKKKEGKGDMSKSETKNLSERGHILVCLRRRRWGGRYRRGSSRCRRSLLVFLVIITAVISAKKRRRRHGRRSSRARGIKKTRRRTHCHAK